MKSSNIATQNDLKLRILQLKAEQNQAAENLKESFEDMKDILRPANLAKNAFSDLFQDKQIQQDLTQLGLTFGSNMLISYLFGKNKNFKRFVGSSLVEQFTTNFIQNNIPLIMDYFELLIAKGQAAVAEDENDQELSETDRYAQYAQ
ncbi:MAG: hypothetical protein IPI60_16825 [Saprospiraceae bacterium]|nr:hypothetical protein [Saprospiraceae bacterium]